MSRYKYQSKSVDGNGKVIVSATISVFESGTDTKADVYAAESGGSAVNSVTTDSNGYFFFWVDEADYALSQTFRLKISKTNFRTKTYDDIVVFPKLESDLVADLTPQLGGDLDMNGHLIQTVNETEMTYVKGVTSGIQVQIDSKQVTIIGAATTIDTEDLTASRALASNGLGKVVVAATTLAELEYVSGVTSGIQAQLNTKINIVDDRVIKGWINFQGTGTPAINDSFNVLSLVDDGTGIFTINWDVDFADANYSVVVSASTPTGTQTGDCMVASPVVQTASAVSFRVQNISGSLTDPDNVSVIAIGDQ